MDADCGEGMVCEAEECRMAPMPVEDGPVAGELIITELLSDPHNGLIDDNAEWIEILNAGDRALNLNGCNLADQGIVDGGNDAPARLDGLGLAPNERLLFARSENPEVNGGLAVDGTFAFALSNGGDTVYIRCGGLILDAVQYGGESNIPRARTVAYNRSEDDRGGPNAENTNWCEAQEIYLQDPLHRGTPGAPNSICR